MSAPTLNPTSFRLPQYNLETPEGREAAHRYAATGILDLNQAIVALKAQIGTAQSAATSAIIRTAPSSPANPVVVPGNTPVIAHEFLDAYDATAGAFSQAQPDFADLTGIAAVVQGGTGTSTPNLVAGTNVTITGAWPNQTIASSGGSAINRLPHVVTGLRAFSTTYQNTSGGEMWVTGYGLTSGGSTADIDCLIGSGSPITSVWGNEATATVSGGKAGFSFPVPNSYFYAINVTGAITSVGTWVEFY